MTKQNPDKLCKECQKFDYDMNRKGGSSSDIFVVCEHAEGYSDLSPPIAEIENNPL